MAKIMTEQEYGCACEHQIIWFFSEPTICACPNCERTYYHNVAVCPTCNAPICYFELSDESRDDFYRVVEGDWE